MRSDQELNALREWLEHKNQQYPPNRSVDAEECLKLLNELTALKKAVRDAGFGILQASNGLSIHDVSEAAKAEEAKTAEVIAENIDLKLANERLRAVARRYKHIRANAQIGSAKMSNAHYWRISNSAVRCPGMTFDEAVDASIDAAGGVPGVYDPEFGDDRVCVCGHPYHRHFDSYEDMEPVGCKYCDCETFKEAAA